MDYILQTNELTKTYGSKIAADKVSLHIRKGEVYGLIGRNGAGKTTILKMICGLSHPTSGTFTFLGKENKNLGKEMKKIGSLIETPGLFLKMTAYENVKLKCLSLGKNDKEYVNSLLELVGLKEVANKQAQGFSLGMKQRLGIALALVGEPEFIVLDEPINGLDPQGIAEMRTIIHKLSKEKGITIIVSSHILEELVKVADSFGIINSGKLIDEFTSDELSDRCAQYIYLRVSNINKTTSVLKKMGISNYEVGEKEIKIMQEVKDSSELNSALVNADIKVYELAYKQITLEEYYLSRTGRAV